MYVSKLTYLCWRLFESNISLLRRLERTKGTRRLVQLGTFPVSRRAKDLLTPPPVNSYCFGGAIAVRIGSTDIFDSLVVLHPGGVNSAQIKKVKKPTAWVCAEGTLPNATFATFTQ